MSTTSNQTSRARRSAGTPAGCQFAPEAHAEPEVTLDASGTAPSTQPSESRREVDADGTVRWFDAAGDPHRDGGPAVERASGMKKWYQHGELHRDGAPAIEWPDGSTFWWQYGQLHRDGGPAVEYADGVEAWFQYGDRHRVDGPAHTNASGRREFWVHGRRLTEDAFRLRFPEASAD